MKLVIGILLLIVGLWFLWGTIRGKKPRVSFVGVSRAHYRGDYVTGSLLTILFVGTGMCLIFGIAWWWIFLVSSIAVTAIWLMLYSRWIEKSYLKGDKDTTPTEGI